MDRNTLTYERLHETLDYNHCTGVFTWKEAIGRRAVVGQVAGYKGNRGYTQIRVDGKLYLSHRLAWFYVYGFIPENGLDHINRICDDNRIINLREVSPQCNLRNSKDRINNTSGVKGICWDNERGKWIPQITIENKLKFLGRYSDFDEAVCVRLAAEQCVNWSGCDSTSSAYLYVQKMLEEK